MAYKALPFEEEHRRQVLSLWKNNMSDKHIATVAERRFSWYYSHNPGGKPTTCLLLDDTSGQIVGSGSFFPRKLSLHGRVLQMGILSDFVVDRAHRAAGPALSIQRWLTEASRTAGIDFLAAYPSRAAEVIFKRIGYKAVGTSRRWVKPLRSRREIGKRVSHPAVAGTAARVVDFGLAALDIKRIASLTAAVKSLRGTYLNDCDRRFDALWQRAKHEDTITGERTSAYLNWRYGGFPSHKYHFFALATASGDRLAAYLTFFVDRNNTAVIGDLFGEDLDCTIDALLVRFSAAERNAGRTAISLDYLGPDAFGERLRSAGFYRRPAERSLFVHFSPGIPEDAQRLVLDEANWYTLDAEMDI